MSAGGDEPSASRGAAFLATLLRTLRAEGVGVSPGEAIDAARALELVPLEDRALVEAALGATLAKSRAAGAALGRALAAALPAPSRDAVAPGRPGKGKRPAPPGVSVGTSFQARTSDAHGGAAASGASGGRGAAPAGPVLPPARRPEERRGRERREKALARLEAGERDPGGRESDGSLARGRGCDERDRAAEERRRRRRRARTASVAQRAVPESDAASEAGAQQAQMAREARVHASLEHDLRRDLRGPLGPEEEDRAERLLERLTASIRTGAGRRRRPGRRGALDAHRLFRRAVATGGVPFSLPRRSRAPRPLRLVLLVDVSWSARRAARAFLVLARALSRRFRETRVLLFVDRPVEVRGAAARGEGLRRAARPTTAFPGEGKPLPEPRGLRAGARSDYAKALFALLRGFQDALRRDALLVVLGDARNNGLPPEAWCLEEIAARVAGVVWLVPEPRERWGAGDSAILDYARSCDVLREGATLADLVEAVRGLAALR